MFWGGFEHFVSDFKMWFPAAKMKPRLARTCPTPIPMRS